MSITVKRKTGLWGSGSNIQIKVNGETVTSIAENQQVEIDLPQDKAHLKVSQSGVKSKEIEVKDGEVLQITPTRWYRMNFPLLIVVVALLNFIPGFYRLIMIFLLSSFLISLLFLINGFYLKVLENGD